MDNNKIVQSFWSGKHLTKMEQMCIRSFQMNGHEFHLYCYEDINGVPEGTIIKDANSILPRNKLFLDSRRVVASFADWFRYKLLYDSGGWWVDMDAVCLKYFDIKDEYCFSTEGYSGSVPEVNIGFIKAPKGAEFLADCLEYIDSQRSSSVTWGTFGPRLFRQVLNHYDWEKHTRPPEVFCPIHWPDIYRFITLQEYVPNKATLAIHLWNEMWRLARLPKDAFYHPNSLYEQLKIRFGV